MNHNPKQVSENGMRWSVRLTCRKPFVDTQALASLLVGDSSLSSLFLRANMIGDEGARAFKIVLLHSQTLTT